MEVDSGLLVYSPHYKNDDSEMKWPTKAQFSEYVNYLYPTLDEIRQVPFDMSNVSVVEEIISRTKVKYCNFLRKWENQYRSQFFSFFRRKIFITSTRSEGYLFSEHALTTELDVFEMILTFLAGESEWLRIAFGADPYPRDSYKKYYLNVASQFSNGTLLEKIKLDPYLFKRAQEYMIDHYTTDETAIDPDDEEVFNMEE
jgi:hypothetical protein